jgi:hypothetical protein
VPDDLASLDDTAPGLATRAAARLAALDGIDDVEQHPAVYDEIHGLLAELLQTGAG